MAWLIKWWMPVIGWLQHDVRDRCYPIERPGRRFGGARRLRTNFRSTKIGSKKVAVNPAKNVSDVPGSSGVVSHCVPLAAAGLTIL
jgi:hypothetical protein